MGSERDLGADRVAELRRLAAYANAQGLAGGGDGLVGNFGLIRYNVRVSGREYFPVWPPFLWRTLALSARSAGFMA